MNLFQIKKPTKETLFLKKREFEQIQTIFAQVQSAVSCEIVISGSIAQRAKRPDLAQALAGKPLSDIDIVLPKGDLNNCPVLPKMKEYFYITHINKMFGGYYFGMIHKKTRRWVDLFSEPYPREYHKVMIGGKEYSASTIESQILHLAYDILSRVKSGADIRAKWIKKLYTLWRLENISLSALEQEYEAHKDYFISLVQPEIVGSLTNVEKYINYALEQGDKYAVPYVWRRKIKYPTDCIATSNGITIESKSTFAKLFASRFPMWLRKILNKV